MNLPENIWSELKQTEDTQELVDFSIIEMWTLSVTKKTLFTRELAEYENKSGILAKLDYLRQRIFLPKRVMAQNYPVSSDSLFIYPYYLVRIKDLLCRHHRNFQQLSLGNHEATTTASRKNKLWYWLNDE